jgi:hypothetical protein
LNKADIERILEHAKTAVQDHVRAHTGGVWQESTGDSPIIGSLTCIRIADRLFLATAAHNFKDLRKSGKVTVFSSSVRSTTPLNIIGSNYSEYGDPGSLDCAWLEVDLESAKRAKLEGVPLKYVDAYHQLTFKAGGGNYDVVGMPAELARFEDDEKTRHYQIPIVVYNTHPGSKATPKDDDLRVDYHEAAEIDGTKVSLPHPGGLSGGGIWFLRDVTLEELWSPANNRLVGIITTYVESSHEVIGLRMYHWLNLLLQDHPELKEEIEPLLNSRS